MTTLITLLSMLLNVLWFAIFARAIVSWFPVDQNGPVIRALDAITEPVLEPLRRVVPRIGLFDITPMVAIILILIIQQMLVAGLR